MAGQGIEQLDLSCLRPDVRAVVEAALAGGQMQMQIAQPLQDWQLITLMATQLYTAGAPSPTLRDMQGSTVRVALTPRESAVLACELFGESVAYYKTGAAKAALDAAAERFATRATDGRNPPGGTQGE